MSTPLVIAHRGASGHRPEHTLAAYRLAFRMGADSVEPDLLATRDGVLICRHDLDLGPTTDVARRPEFAGRRRPQGWLVPDFTLPEIKSLRARERWPRKRAASARFDGHFEVATFDELLRLVTDESGRRGKRLRVHAEIKHPEWYDAEGRPLDDALLDAGRGQAPITWMSFDAAVLKRLSRKTTRPIVQLADPGGPRHRLARVADYATGIGPGRRLVLPRTRDGGLGEPGALVRKAHRRGLDVLVWTLRNENRHLPEALHLGRRPRRHGRADVEVRAFLDAGVDGVLTDFPDTAVATRRAWLEERTARSA